ncbi:MAG: VWA domain-containing protein [Deltaproteobacteria bacterium]|nr:VWA domain-containing protein [Deltaproteobacteria bacterium]
MPSQFSILIRGWGLFAGLFALLTLMPSCYISYRIGDTPDRDEKPAAPDGGLARVEDAESNQPYKDIAEHDAEVLQCPTVQVRMPTDSPTVIILIDSSYTMQDPFRGTEDSRWGALRNALLNPDTGLVKPLEGKIKFGLVFFGGSVDFGCPFETKYEYVLATINNYSRIESAYPASMFPGVSYTPTGRALYQVCGSLPSLAVATNRGLGTHYIVLATDGNPNGCPEIDFSEVEPPNDFESAESAARYCVDRGIMVLPLSLADDLDQEHLQKMADIGSERDDAVVYQPQNPAALRRDLEELMGTVSCRIRLDISDGQIEYEIDEDLASCRDNRGRVLIDGVSIPCGPDGWLVSGSQAIELQGDACETYKNRVDVTPTISFPCDVFVPKS